MRAMTLASTPLDALDAAWAGRLLAAAPADRSAALSEADALRGEGGDGPSRARACYRALAPTLDAARALDAERLLWLLRNDIRRDAPLAAAAARCRSARDPRLASSAEVILAECDAEARRYPEADVRLRALLGRVRGSDPAAEFDACAALARVYFAEGREFEALVLSRRCVDLAANDPDPWSSAIALARIAGAYLALDDLDRLALAQARLEVAIRRVPADRAWMLRRTLEGQCVEVALRRGDMAAARSSLAAMRAASPVRAGVPGDSRWDGYLEALIAFRSGNPREARRIAEGLRPPAGSPYRSLAVEMLSARCALAIEGPAAGAVAAREVLEGLSSSWPIAEGTGTAIRLAAELAAFFREECRSPADARRAYDLAGTAVVRRMAEIDRCVAELPELSATSDDDQELLASFRLRFVEKQHTLLKEVAQVLVQAFRAGEGPLAEIPGPDGFVAVCAWCRRARWGAGRWLPIGHLMPGSDARLQLTHGICPECYRRSTEQALRPPSNG